MADNTMAKKGKGKKRPNIDLQSTIKKTKDWTPTKTVSE